MARVRSEGRTYLEKFFDSIVLILLFLPFALSFLRARLVSSLGYAVYLFADRSIDLFQRVVRQDVPQLLKWFIKLHLVLHSFFGHFMHFYDFVPFWDKMLHFFGTFIVAWFFFHALINDSKYWSKLGERRAGFEAFLLSNFAGILWEIAEFIVDKIFSIGAQRGLDDTMFDLIFNVFGSYFGVRFAQRIERGDGSDREIEERCFEDR